MVAKTYEKNPIVSNSSVGMCQPIEVTLEALEYAKENLEGTYDQKTEEEALVGLYTRMASQFLNDLYLKADVKDTRYLFF